MNRTDWFKSSHSNGTMNCVEVRATPASVSARDTKDRTRGKVTVSAAGWRAFIGGVTTGSLK